MINTNFECPDKPSNSFLTGKRVDSFQITNNDLAENCIFCFKNMFELGFAIDSDQEILTDDDGFRYKREMTPEYKNLIRFRKI